jgi:apolipoprotein D and lipocalin family protein
MLDTCSSLLPPHDRSLFRNFSLGSSLFRRLVAAAALVATVSWLNAPAGAADAPPLKTVRHVDINRYVGDWFVIANIPYFAEKDCVGSVESYGPRPDGRMDNWFTFHKKSFDAPVQKFTALAWVYNKQTNAEWRVRFLNLFTSPYLVLDLDPKYQWTVVGHPSRNYGWIMARTKRLPEAKYHAILQRLAQQGYDPKRFVKVPQLPSDLAATPKH